MTRDLRAEVMDDPGLAPERHRRALRGLARLNRASSAAAILWPHVRAALARSGGVASLLDVATGSGDVPIDLALRAGRAGMTLRLSACDRSPVALEAARENAARAGVEVMLSRLDVTADALPEHDVVTCSLFLHHLDEANAAAVLARMKAGARRLVLASDLRRTRAGLALAWGASRLLSRSDVVHDDAVLSVRGAYTPDELRALARRAGLEGAVVEPAWPQRMLLRWSRP